MTANVLTGLTTAKNENATIGITSNWENGSRTTKEEVLGAMSANVQTETTRTAAKKETTGIKKLTQQEQEESKMLKPEQGKRATARMITRTKAKNINRNRKNKNM